MYIYIFDISSVRGNIWDSVPSINTLDIEHTNMYALVPF